MERKQFVGRKNHSRSRSWLTAAAFTGAMMAPLATSAQTPSFGGATNFAAQTGPQSVAVASFNEITDSFPDFAVVNFSSNSLSVFLGDGLGGFAAAANIPLGGAMGPVDLAVGDVNGDGHLDIVTANGNSNNVSVLLGDGLGGFTPATGSPFAAGTTCQGIAIGEVTGDTFVDIVVANSGSGNISVLTGNGTGAFTGPTNYAVGVSPRDVALARLNADGLLDVIVTNFGSGGSGTGGGISVLLNVAGVLGPAVNITTGDGARNVAVGNLNGDAFVDVVVANRFAVSVSVLLGKGDGTFQPVVSYPAGVEPFGIAVGDFNLDNKADVVVSNFTSNIVTVLPGDGAGGLSAGTTFPTTALSPIGVGAGDFNRDGKLDLVVPNFDSANASVLLNTLVRDADLGVTVTDDSLTATPGAAVSYTIVVSNAGPNTLNQLRLTDTLPTALLTPGFAPATGAYNSGTGAWTGISLAPGGSVTMTVSGTVDPAATGTFVNGVHVDVIAPDTETTDTASNDASDTDTLVRLAALTVGKTDGQTNATPGSPVSYTITVSNAGPSTLSQLTLTDTLPAALQTPVFTPTTGAYNTGTGAWTGITLAAGGSVTMTVAGTISPTATGTLVNSVAVGVIAPDTETDTTNNSASDTDTLVRSAELTVTNTDGQTNATAGATVTYTLTVNNAGPSTLNQISLIDTLPAALQTPVFTPATGSYNSGTGAWTGITLAPAGSVTMTVAGTISASATGTLVNSVAVAVVAPDTETNTGNNSASDTDTLVRSANLTVTKTDGQATAAPGAAVSYTITVSNAGPSTLSQLTLTDTLPAALLSPVFAPGTGAYNSGTGAWTGITLTPSGSVTMTVSGTISAAATGTLVNSVAVATIAPDTDPTPGNNTASDTDTLVASADLSITKTGPGAVAPGLNVTYTITVTNLGPSNAAGVSVADITPAGVTFVSNAGDCATVFPCNLGAMSAGQIKTITTTFAVGAGFAGATLSNTATVGATTADPAAPNNSSTATSTVSTSANLALTNTGPASFTPGHDLTYTIVVTNNGPANAATVQVTDPTPTGLVFVSNNGDCTNAFPCALGLVAPTATRTITATYSVPAGYAGPYPIQNTASVSSATTDPDATDNSATATSNLSGQVFFTLSPCRVLDTRDPAGPHGGPALAPGPTRTFILAGTCQVPSTAKAVSVNVTVTEPTAAGDLRIYPAGSAEPLASAINYAAGQTRANNALVPLGTGGGLEVLAEQASGTVHFILDVNGYFE
jgi:uncharacterized repeat protein (TIGR01451 family)